MDRINDTIDSVYLCCCMCIVYSILLYTYNAYFYMHTSFFVPMCCAMWYGSLVSSIGWCWMISWYVGVFVFCYCRLLCLLFVVFVVCCLLFVVVCCLFVCLFVCLLACLFVCLFVCCCCSSWFDGTNESKSHQSFTSMCLCRFWHIVFEFMARKMLPGLPHPVTVIFPGLSPTIHGNLRGLCSPQCPPPGRTMVVNHP